MLANTSSARKARQYNNNFIPRPNPWSIEMRTEKKQKLRQLRRYRIRKKVSGTTERPRMAVCFTSENIHVQFIDDTVGKTLAAASTVTKGKDRELSANVDGAKKLGAIAAKNAIDKGIKEVVFDRGG